VTEQLALFEPTPTRPDKPLDERRAWLHPDGSYRSWEGDLFPGLEEDDATKKKEAA
jgi:hypothetical protein